MNISDEAVAMGKFQDALGDYWGSGALGDPPKLSDFPADAVREDCSCDIDYPRDFDFTQPFCRHHRSAGSGE